MQISAKVIQHSLSKAGVELVTFELEYPRFIHSELMTHRVFSRNAASSRAIPISKMIAQVSTNPASPVHWGTNMPGMQARKEVLDIVEAKWAWGEAAKSAVKSAELLEDIGLHKQIVNRVLEPFQMMKTIVTATEWENFFELRTHKDAQPEFQELACMMQVAIAQSVPFHTEVGEWHVPYVSRYRCPEYKNIFYYIDNEDQEDITAQQAVMVSASCAAQVSYRLLDGSMDKAEKIYSKLINSKPIHASPFEHQAVDVNDSVNFYRNFKGWKQNRQYIEGN